MSEPREHWASDPNKYKSGVYTSKKCMDGQILFIEKSTYDQLNEKYQKAVECLKFYVGGEHSDIDIDVFDHIKVVSDTTTEFDSEWLCGPAIETLKELGEL